MEVKMHAAGYLQWKYLQHVPNGEHLVVLFLDRPISKLSFCSTSEILPPLHAVHTQTHVLTHTYTHFCDSGEWNIVLLRNLTSQTVKWGEIKALGGWKNMKTPLFQWSRKNSREKCQQQIAAGFSCRRRHGLWFSHVSFHPHYASCFHPIKHKHRLRRITQGESYRTAHSGRNRRVGIHR